MFGNFPEFATTSGNTHSPNLLVVTQGVTKLMLFQRRHCRKWYYVNRFIFRLMKVAEKNKNFYK